MLDSVMANDPVGELRKIRAELSGGYPLSQVQ
jgi:hypothetical protein